MFNPSKSRRPRARVGVRIALAVALVLANLFSITNVMPLGVSSPNIASAQQASTDLAVEKTAEPTYVPGGTIEYTIEITNPAAADGGFDVADATLVDTVPAEITDVSWSCEATGENVCDEATGTGNEINTTFDIVAGGTVTYTVTGTAPTGTPPPDDYKYSDG